MHALNVCRCKNDSCVCLRADRWSNVVFLKPSGCIASPEKSLNTLLLFIHVLHLWNTLTSTSAAASAFKAEEITFNSSLACTHMCTAVHYLVPAFSSFHCTQTQLYFCAAYNDSEMVSSETDQLD